MKKIGRNDKCHCGSMKKYKVCCLSDDARIQQETKVDMSKWYDEGHEITQEVQQMYDYFNEKYPSMKIIDVSNVIVGKGSYTTLLTKHYDLNTIMLGARNEKNDKIFESKGDDSTNLMVMFRGAHQVFNDYTFGSMKKQIDVMIEKRLKDEPYNY